MRCHRVDRVSLLVALLIGAGGILSGCGAPPEGRSAQRQKRVLAGGDAILGDVPVRDPGPERAPDRSGGVDPGPGGGGDADPGPGGGGGADPGPGAFEGLDPGPGPARAVEVLPAHVAATDGVERGVEVRFEGVGAGRPPEGSLVLLGFRPMDVTAAGALKPGRRPEWMWASETVALSSPLTVTATLPAGLAVVAFIDLDGDRGPSQGELMSAVDREFAPPAEGTQAEFVIDRRFGVD